MCPYWQIHGGDSSRVRKHPQHRAGGCRTQKILDSSVKGQPTISQRFTGVLFVSIQAEAAWILCKGHGLSPWHLPNLYPSADLNFGLAPTSILCADLLNLFVFVEVGSEGNSRMKDLWRLHFVLGCLECYWKILQGSSCEWKWFA